ncbi:hypothetical protein BBJ28_00009615 [Nothophytophthora sp. Chile5]|nr:hypothetical protein BBJ28_00009615 [Nothophytophthora sp. Chile5]
MGSGAASTASSRLPVPMLPLLMLVMTIATAPLAGSVHVTVPSSDTECFSVEAESFKHGISLNYQVLRGMADELETELTDGKQQIVYANKGALGRYVSPIGEGGLHSVCFKNVVAPVGDVVVGFSFHADDPSHEVLSNADATKINGDTDRTVVVADDSEQVQELEDLVYELSVNLDTVKDTQAYMKAITNHHNNST